MNKINPCESGKLIGRLFIKIFVFTKTAQMRTVLLLAIFCLGALSAGAYTTPRPLGRYLETDGYGNYWYVYSDGVHPEYNTWMDDSFQTLDPYDADFVDDVAVTYFYYTYGEKITEGDFTGTGQGFDADDPVPDNVAAPFDASVLMFLGVGLLASLRFKRHYYRLSSR